MPKGIRTVDLVPRHLSHKWKQWAGTGTRPYDECRTCVGNRI